MTEAPVVIGRYVLGEAIGGGGMASVHLGRMLGVGGFSRVVAIKRLHPPAARDPDFTTMLLDEARLASRIRHPNVVPTLDVIEEGRELLLVMEYVHGASLDAIAAHARAAETRIPLPVAVRIVLDVLAGLQAAHEARSERGRPLELVHRDVSPHNVLVGVDGIARVVDFGFATALGKLSTTRDGQIKGKLTYMAPEQLRGEGVDRRADVHATGVVLWELVTGRRLIDTARLDADDLIGMIRAVLAQAHAPPRTIVPDLPAALESVIMTALAPSRDDRYPTAEAMILALEAASPAATTKEVAAYVASGMSTLLAARSAIVADIEQASAVLDVGGARTPEPAPVPRVEATALLAVSPSHDEIVVEEGAPEPARRPRAGVWIALGVLGFVAIGIALAALVARSIEGKVALPPSRSASAPGASEIASVTRIVPVVRALSPEPSASEASASSAPSALPPSTAAASGPPTRPLHSTSAVRKPPPAPDCDPPYAIDARGIRVPRRECLGLDQRTK